MSEIYFTIKESEDRSAYVVSFLNSALPSFSILKTTTNVFGDSMTRLTMEVSKAMEDAKRKREEELAISIAGQIRELVGKR